MRLHIEADGHGPTFLATILLGLGTGVAVASYIHHRAQELAAVDFAEALCADAAYADEDEDE